ncbi:hypothetical protein KOI35_22330 [Actinoplanes bogorensis]|uniref:Uncharacterized protein n=1 Tax=Paractinoplanes bogorensis TaxID=1610840 RepID=A0ABS5YU72_9ACTN|nr:hypothetical protein [Actinoplanes bogorensis]MBU2666243.1 hypothetical protein [Actinoplanes bogorensis]
MQNAARWHRLTAESVEPVRARLAPRARLLVWPDLDPDVAAVLGSLPGDAVTELVGLDRTGGLTSRMLDEVGEADAGESPPLMAAVLPDPDGVVRARWGF